MFPPIGATSNKIHYLHSVLVIDRLDRFESSHLPSIYGNRNQRINTHFVSSIESTLKYECDKAATNTQQNQPFNTKRTTYSRSHIGRNPLWTPILQINSVDWCDPSCSVTSWDDFSQKRIHFMDEPLKGREWNNDGCWEVDKANEAKRVLNRHDNQYDHIILLIKWSILWKNRFQIMKQ